MRQRQWISALQIEGWAQTEDAKTRLPELIRRLIHATVASRDLEHIDFPAGEQTQRPDFDGVTKVKIGRGNAMVPDQITYWEMGKNVGRKGET